MFSHDFFTPTGWVQELQYNTEYQSGVWSCAVQEEMDDVTTDSITPVWNWANEACDRINLWSCRRKCMHGWAFLVIVMMFRSCLEDASRELHDEALLEWLCRMEHVRLDESRATRQVSKFLLQSFLLKHKCTQNWAKGLIYLLIY